VKVKVQIDHQMENELNVVVSGVEVHFLNFAPKDDSCEEGEYKNNVESLKNGWLETRECWWSECQNASGLETKLQLFQVHLDENNVPTALGESGINYISIEGDYISLISYIYLIVLVFTLRYKTLKKSVTLDLNPDYQTSR
jgi:hypothetical protein